MTRRSGWALVAIALLVVLAGCSLVPSSEEGSIAETVTPVPVPSAADSEGAAAAAAAPTTETGLDAFPGVSARWGIDVDRLLSAHVAYLSTRSYTVEWARWTAGGTGPVAERFERRVEVEDNRTYLRRDRGVSGGNVTSTYVGSESAYRRAIGGETTVVSPTTVRDSDPARERFARLIAYEMGAFLSAGYDELDVVERGGRRYARAFVTRSPRELAQVYDAYALRNFTATVWIAPEGYVQAVHYEFDLVGARHEFAVEWRYAYTDVGETTVDRPPWVPTDATARSPSNETTIDPAPAETSITDPARVPPSTVANASTPG